MASNSFNTCRSAFRPSRPTFPDSTRRRSRSATAPAIVAASRSSTAASSASRAASSARLVASVCALLFTSCVRRWSSSIACSRSRLTKSSSARVSAGGAFIPAASCESFGVRAPAMSPRPPGDDTTSDLNTAPSFARWSKRSTASMRFCSCDAATASAASLARLSTFNASPAASRSTRRFSAMTRWRSYLASACARALTSSVIFCGCTGDLAGDGGCWRWNSSMDPSMNWSSSA